MIRPDASDAQDRSHRMEGLIGYLLLAGVLLSVALILAGLIWQFAASGRLRVEQALRGMNLAEFVCAEISAAASGRLRPAGLVNLGIIVLLLTPYLRVLASALFFAIAQRDWKYAAITGFVLAVLTYSLFLH